MTRMKGGQKSLDVILPREDIEGSQMLGEKKERKWEFSSIYIYLALKFIKPFQNNHDDSVSYGE